MPPTTTGRSDATVRQLKWLVVVLIFSNIALGIFSVFALRRADKRYSELIDRTVPVLNDLQTLTAHAGQAMGATNPAKLDTMARDAFVRTAQGALALEQKDRTTAIGDVWLTDAKAERQEIETAGQAFSTAAGTMLARIEGGNLADAARIRDADVRPAFHRYIAAITKAADMLEAEGRNANHSATRSTGRDLNVLLGFAGWPIIIVGGLLAVTAAIVLVLLLLFRGRESV